MTVRMACGQGGARYSIQLRVTLSPITPRPARSVAVSNPHQRRWSLVRSANLAAGGKLELMLLDPAQSAAGLALRSGKLVQSSLLNGAAQFSARLGDVAAMVAAAPGTKYLLCLPFKPAAQQQQQQQAAPRSGGGALEGALLLGLDAAEPPGKRCVRTAGVAGSAGCRRRLPLGASCPRFGLAVSAPLALTRPLPRPAPPRAPSPCPRAGSSPRCCCWRSCCPARCGAQRA